MAINKGLILTIAAYACSIASGLLIGVVSDGKMKAEVKTEVTKQMNAPK